MYILEHDLNTWQVMIIKILINIINTANSSYQNLVGASALILHISTSHIYDVIFVLIKMPWGPFSWMWSIIQLYMHTSNNENISSSQQVAKEIN